MGSYWDEYRENSWSKPVEIKVDIKEEFQRSTLTSKRKSGSGPTRGRIQGFSKKSRIRAMKKTASVKKGFFKYRFELTYPDDVMQGLTIEERAKLSSGHIHRLQDWVKRHYPGMGLYWKKEIKPRKSGDLTGEWVFHYHFMAGFEGKDWNNSQWIDFFWNLGLKWVKIIKTKQVWESTAVTLNPESFGPLTDQSYTRYWSKYISKPTELEGFYTGRTWGTIGPIPYQEAEAYVIRGKQKVMLQRLVRRYLSRQKVKKNKNGKVEYVKPKKRYWEQWRRLGFEGFCLLSQETANKMLQISLQESPSLS